MNKALTEKLSTAQDRLAEAVTALNSGHKRIAKAEQGLSAVTAELEQLEARVEHHPDDEAATARLLLLREQKERFDARIASFWTEAERQEEDRRRVDMENALSAAVDAVVEAGRPELDRLTRQAAAALAPFYLPGTTSLETAVARCDAVRSLKAFLINGGNGYDRLASVQRVLDALLSTGSLGWSWPPVTVKAPAEPVACHA